ncbi:uncharacterized protein LOC131153787 [Malania oleifera]|uniref:uncharacterized protein LOC131153787 n=1 Tax=Malania oleifera TaxID=397392 RepID=UPI0025ADB1A4|nr:uncharacterized protein LOC131153787 [Malania oleifera]
MEAVSFNFSLFLPSLDSCRKMVSGRRMKRRSRVRVSKRDGDFSYGGKLVDDNMIVLRKRIREMSMAEGSYVPPSDWMDWEKQYYKTYNSDVCEAMGILQSVLMNTRPSLALGIFVLIALSVPTSAAVIVFCLVGRALGMVAGFDYW